MRDFVMVTVGVTIAACILFMLLNPVLFTDFEPDYVQDEVFYPADGQYNFRLFNISVTNSSNFTVDIIKAGHAKLMSGKGYAINVLNYDKMLDFEVRGNQKSIEAEMKRSYQTVDGVRVYEADFILYKRYGSFVKKDNLELFITSDSPNETAYMVNSLKIV